MQPSSNIYKRCLLSKRLVKEVSYSYMRSRRGQSSVEYLFIVALALTLILPASFLFFDFSKSSEDAVVSAQINRAGNEIVSKAEEVYVIGNNSRVTVELTMPDGIESVVIYAESELVVSYYTAGGVSQAVFFTDIPIMNGTDGACVVQCPVNMVPGTNMVRITSLGDEVAVTRV